MNTTDDSFNISKLHHSQKGFSHVEVLILVVIICMIGFVGWRIWQTNQHQIIKINNQNTTSQPSPLLTYVSIASPQTFIATNAQNKVLAKVNIEKADNTFYTFAKNSQALLLGETYNATEYSYPGTNQIYVLVNYNGSATILSSAVATIITNMITEYSGSQLLLNGNNTLFYVDCNQTTQNCDLDNLNLLSGEITTYLTEPGTQTDGGTQAPFDLMGIKNNVLFYDYSSNGTLANQAIVSYSLLTHTILKTDSLQVMPLNPPKLSNDSSEAIYTDSNNDGTRYIINIANGKETVLNSNIPSDNEDYLWSPDNQYIAFSSPYPGTSSANQQESINYIDVTTGQAKTIKTFGDSTYNEVELYVWTSNSRLYYSVTQTNSANDFTSNPDAYNLISIPSGNVSPNPAPNGYVIFGSPPGTVYDEGP